MSYDDKKLGTIFPTRTGPAQGQSNERTMLDGLNDTTGYRTGIRLHPDGSYTMVRTKGGQPQFTTTQAPTSAALLVAYLESGQMEFTAPVGDTQFDPAKWHFLDIPTTDPFLGRIRDTAGTQRNTPALAEAQDSKAIGYPHPTDTTLDAETKAAYGGATAMKKLVAGFFPPSLYSGKMRLLLQSLYGAAERTGAGPLEVDLVGSSAVLKYTNAGVSLTLGLSASSSPGVFTDADGTFWLVMITNPTGAEYVFTAYPINASAQVRDLVTYYRAHLADLLSPLKEKIEAYIFAASVISLATPITVGTFPAPAGGAIAYGWKWNSDGSKASIVVHATLGTGVADLRFSATTIHATITSSGSGASKTFGVTAETTAGGEWTDGWDAYNIFRPQDETSIAPLELFSIKLDPAGVLPDFNYADVPVYGYYKEDVWTPVKLSRTILPAPIYEEASTGIIYQPAFSEALNPTLHNRYLEGAVPGAQPCAFESHDTTLGDDMTLAVGSATYLGTSRFGAHVYFRRYIDLPPGGTGSTQVNSGATLPFTTSPMTAGTQPPGPPPGFPATGLITTTNTNLNALPIGLETVSFSGWAYHQWALVIPAGDSEAVFVALHNQDLPNASGFNRVTNTAMGTDSYSGHTDTFGASPGVSFAYHPWSQASEIGTTSGLISTTVTTTDTGGPPATETTVNCFSSVLDGEAGVPGGSYETLFTVDRDYPYYDRGMYSYTSSGQRYAQSEGLKSPDSVNYQNRFVGWA